jgi:type I restriction enzyme R subunit
LVVELKTPSQAGQKLLISGVEVTIAEEVELTLDGENGHQLSVSEYRDYAGEQVRTEAGNRVTLAELWRDPAARRQLRAQLRKKKVDPAILGILMNRGDADEFDLLANVAFGERIRTREERARELEQPDVGFLKKYNEAQRSVVEQLLDKYRVSGVEEIATAEVFKLPPFLEDFGGIPELAKLFGGADSVATLLRDLQAHLYPTEDWAA